MVAEIIILIIAAIIGIAVIAMGRWFRDSPPDNIGWWILYVILFVIAVVIIFGIGGISIRKLIRDLL